MPNAPFNYQLNFEHLDFRQHPEQYRIGKGEQGVLLVEPYKSEILPHWRFKTPDIAVASAQSILQLFEDYKQAGDFVGMDMARKFLQMGYTRSRRYANHKGGKKYDGPVPENKKGQSGAHGRAELPRTEDEVKAESAKIFYGYWQQVKNDAVYQEMAITHRRLYEGL
ncbi:DUF4385 domain-containing protein [Mucilaginibacter sp. CSA2-8R]|uniref:DUF4385 domain-containing protein n=1 Tax=Mucilaginibacter sp. CSA2-8R TaxID=3141542 RepID=UPI00315D2AF4